MEKLTEQIIVEIIKGEMSLDDNNVWIRDQNRKIPPSATDLFVVVGMVNTTVIASQTYMKQVEAPPGTFTQYEVNEVQSMEMIQVDVLSRSNAAILRRWEVIAAMRSIASQQAQEANNFQISRLPHNFVNSSLAEGGSQLNRFSMVFRCTTWNRKENALTPDGGDYYDDFDTRVDDANTIGQPDGLIEFNIEAED